MSEEMNRKLIRITGQDRQKFLQGLLTRDVPEAGLGYAALLSPQGKYLADFLTFTEGDAIWLDADSDQTPGLVQRLSMYKLRSDVEIEVSDRPVRAGLEDAPDGAMEDPRPGMGWRAYRDGPVPDVDWDARRIEHLVPHAGVELIPNESYILEMGFERLGGVDFKKGCYVGQEVTARMKHKTELRKGLARVSLDGTALPGTEITADGRAAGMLHTVAGGKALAYLRYDRATGPLTIGDTTGTLDAKST
jgi:folate-binding protein YgfZ